VFREVNREFVERKLKH